MIALFAAAAICLGAAGGAAAETFTEFDLPIANSEPYAIVAGPDGALWFTEPSMSQIGRIAPDGSITEYPLGYGSYSARAKRGTKSRGASSIGISLGGITAGPDGALWFTEPYNGVIGRITTAGVITEFQVPYGRSPLEITAGPDGALWFTEDCDKIGRIAVDGTITEYSLPYGHPALGITSGPDGALWYTSFNGYSGRIGRITTAGVVTEFPLSVPGSQPSYITTGPDGALWFTVNRTGCDQIGRITTAGVLTEFPIPTGYSGPAYITTGPDGLLYFAESIAGKIGRVTTAGVITELDLPTPASFPIGVTRGPNDDIWFVESFANKIGRLGLPKLQLTPATEMVASGPQGGPFSPTSFSYQLTSTDGDADFAVSGVPSWLDVSSSSETASSSPTTIVFSINSAANALPAGSYGPIAIAFTNTSNGLGTQSRTATLSVSVPNYAIQVSASPPSAGTVNGGGTFPGGSTRAVVATPANGYSFANWTEAGNIVSSSAIYSFTLNGNRNLVANFIAAQVSYSITLTATPQVGGTVTGSGRIPAGTTHTVTAVPNQGYAFSKWMENGAVVSLSASYSFVVNGDRNLVANFVNAPKAGSHDFNGDATSDIAWRDGAGNAAIWMMKNTAVSSVAALGNVPPSWSIAGQRDFDGNGKSDLLWRDVTGNVAVWLMNGGLVASNVGLGVVPLSWSIAGTGDFNGDGKGDVLWRDVDGNLAIWQMDGASITSVLSLGKVGTFWTVVGAGDFDGDGKCDILWRDGSGNVAIWLMNGGAVSSAVSIGGVPTSWSVAGTGDFNGDGKSDVLWRDLGGNVALWIMNGAAVSSVSSLGVVPPSWAVSLTGDFNADGKSDVLWRDSGFLLDANGVAIWTMNGPAVSSVTVLGLVANSWVIQGSHAD